MFLLKTLCKDRKKFFFDIFMDKQRLACIADTDPLCLGIEDDIDCHIKICALIHINVAVSGTSLDHRDCALVHNGFNKALSASWNQDIHIFVHLHELSRSLSGSICDQLNGIFCYAVGS